MPCHAMYLSQLVYTPTLPYCTTLLPYYTSQLNQEMQKTKKRIVAQLYVSVR